MGIELLNLDCLDLLKSLPDASVDLMLQDPPYGTTRLEWDKAPDFSTLWPEWLRVCKENAAIIFTSQQPFTTDLINSCRKFYRYEIIWQKTQVMGFLDAKRKPLRTHENIIVFYKKQPTYNPQKTQVSSDKMSWGRTRKNAGGFDGYQEFRKDDYKYVEDGSRYPTSVINISSWNGALFGKTSREVEHPTQKPVDLMRYLIKTFTNPGETVFDGYSGSGTTAVACVREGRNFIGSELNKDYYDNALKRISVTLSKPELFIP